MEKRARDFLEQSAALYEVNKKKWKTSLKKLDMEFDEDVYSDSIIKTYDAILKGEDVDGDVLGYWYRCFITNIKRNKQYSFNSKREDIDVIDYLKDRAEVVSTADIYYPTIRELLEKVKNNYDIKSYHLFKIYYMTDITFEQLSEIVGYDVKTKIMKIKKWLKENV